MSESGRETSGGGSLCLPAVGEQSFWVHNPFAVQDLNPGMGDRFAFSLLESVLCTPLHLSTQSLYSYS